ncbi:hypothetical protein EV401DRAFT_1939652 [Pisolithus croceorrhizus]|nr:hypothetical protein EV401DRAFT_1939652 [Pisolithus croceorrhizus]
MSTSPHPGPAPPIRSTVQHPQGLTCQGDHHVEHRQYNAAPSQGSAGVGAREPQCLDSSTGGAYSVRISEALRLPSYPIIPAPLLARNASLVGYLSVEPGSAQVALSLGYVAGENSASFIGHTSNYITNHNTTLPPSYTSLLPPFAIEQSSGHPQESGDDSTFGYLDNDLTVPTTCLGSVPSLRGRASGQMIGSGAPWSSLSNPLLPSLPEAHPSDDFTISSIPLPPEQTRTGTVVPPQFHSGFATRPTKQIRPWTPFPYAYPIPSQSNSTSYSTSDGSVSSYPSFSMPNQDSSSCSPRERLGYPLPVHSPYSRTVGLPGFYGFDARSEMELHAWCPLDNPTAHVLGDHPSRALSNHMTCLFRSHVTHIPDDHATSGGVDDYGFFDESKLDSERVVGPPPQLSPPPNQLPLSPYRLHVHNRVSRIKGRSLPAKLPKKMRYAC